jgi:hypothetical protein
MNAITLKDDLCRALREKSGLEGQRDYLGMSQIGQCPRKLYFDFVGGLPAFSDQQHWYCWTGYLHEAAVVELLAGEQGSRGAGEEEGARQVEVVAGFDERFRGHVDRVWGDAVIEIKSVGWDKFLRIREAGVPQYEHRCQVQMYLRHGGWRKAFVVYIARDVPHREFEGPPFWVFQVEPDEVLADRMDKKARDILAAIDAGEAPVCVCGYCRR